MSNINKDMSGEKGDPNPCNFSNATPTGAFKTLEHCKRSNG